jgi:murein DD-endopeptidase MepM/ murein hydrolase activator NlpD
MRFTLAALSVVGLIGQADPSTLHVTHRARATAPGEVVLVEVGASTPLKDVKGAFATPLGEPGAAVPFYALDPQRWQALAPIDVEARAGRYVLTIEATTTTGRTLTREYPISVAARAFPSRRITVDAKFADPPADALPRIEKERKFVEGLFAKATSERFWTEPFIVPVPGASTSSFGRRSIVNGQPRSPHTGTDFQAATGTPIVAPNDGRVVLAGDLYFAGNTMIIDHGLGVYSYLAHLSAFDVEAGALVKRGQTIGRSGATGRVTGPHLHWTLRLGAARVDPLSLVAALAPPASPVKKPVLPRKPGRGHA